MLTTAELPVSVSIISFNESANIGRTLDSVKAITAEIIVVDSHSTDNTHEIADAGEDFAQETCIDYEGLDIYELFRVIIKEAMKDGNN